MADYVKNKHDLGFLRTDGTTQVGLRLARDKNGSPIYKSYDDEYLAQQFYSGTPGYGNLPPEKELSIRQDDWRSGFGLEVFDSNDPKRYFSSIGMDGRYKGMFVAGPISTAVTRPSRIVMTDGGLEIWTNPTNLTNWSKQIAGGSTVTREDGGNVTPHGGTYCAKLLDDGANKLRIYQSMTVTLADWKSKGNGVTAWE